MKKSIIAFVLTLCLLLSFPVASGVSAIPADIGIIEAQAATVKLNKTKLTLIKGQTYTLKVSGTKKTVKWSSSKKSVATVSNKGKVTAKKKGTATISAKVGSKTYKCKVTVETPSISKTKAYVAIGKSTTLSVKNTSQKVSWKSSSTSVASVSSNGKVTAKKKGSATITATVGSLKKKYTCKVIVDNTKATEFSKLKEKLNKYGETNSKGIKQFEFTYNDEQSINMYFISIENNTVCFTKHKESGSLTITNVELPKNSNNANAFFEMYYHFKDTVPYCEASCTVNASTYTNNSNIDLTFSPVSYNTQENKDLASDDISDIIKVSKTMLSKYGISISRLGFYNYD